MKNIKLIIDIPEDLYSYISKEDAVYFPDNGGELFETVKNGTPLEEELEEIKTEIGKRKAESKQLSRNDYEMGLSDGRTTEKMAIIQILDKHIKELNNE